VFRINREKRGRKKKQAGGNPKIDLCEGENKRGKTLASIKGKGGAYEKENQRTAAGKKVGEPDPREAWGRRGRGGKKVPNAPHRRGRTRTETTEGGKHGRTSQGNHQKNG